MPSHSIQSELQNFVQFATRQIERGDTAESVEALVQQWRDDAESLATVGDVRQGLLDDASGLAEPAANVFAELRHQLGIAK